MILNYKKIDYKTEWVEYPDLAPKFKSLYATTRTHPHVTATTPPTNQLSPKQRPPPQR